MYLSQALAASTKGTTLARKSQPLGTFVGVSGIRDNGSSKAYTLEHYVAGVSRGNFNLEDDSTGDLSADDWYVGGTGSYSADVLDYLSRLPKPDYKAANAFQVFIDTIDPVTRALVLQMNLYMGQASAQLAIPFINGFVPGGAQANTLNNFNFSQQYTDATGIQGNGTNFSLVTGVAPAGTSDLGQNDISFGV